MSPGRGVLIGAVLLVLIAGVFIAWNFSGRSSADGNAQNSVAVAQDQQYKEAIPESTEKQENESAIVQENDILKEDAPAPIQSKASSSFREKPISSVNKVKTSSETVEKKVVKPVTSAKKPETEVLKASAANKTVAKAGNAKKTQSPNLNSTTLIIVPSAGTSRPRVILSSKNSKPQQSSASEINRFFTGKSIRKQN